MDEVLVTVPADVRHLRTLRLVAADAAGRAHFDASEVDDLRTAVSELSQALMQVTDDSIALRVIVDATTVTVTGCARTRPGDPPPELELLSALMVDAVSDRFRLTGDGTEATFVVTKRAGAFATHD